MDPTIASLIASADHDDRSAAAALFAALYSELHTMAKRQLDRGPSITLSATTLLHETYLDISRRDEANFPDRPRFMAYAARVMRSVIIDYVRNRRAQKRGGLFELTSIGTDIADTIGDDRELGRISDALDELASLQPPLAQIVDLKFFCGFSFGEIAAMRGVSERTIQRQWEKARIFLHRALRDEKQPSFPE